jgi:hypothetical protein
MDILAQGGLAAMRDVKVMLAKRGIEVDLPSCTAWRMTGDNPPLLPSGNHPQGAAGILPAEESEKSSADETSAAPWRRHYPTGSTFMVPMHGIKAVEPFHVPEHPLTPSLSPLGRGCPKDG